MFAAIPDSILDEEADKFFSYSVRRVQRTIKKLHHASRFWLCFKFIRQHASDFIGICEKQDVYSKIAICNLLGIPRNTVNRLKKKYPTRSIKELMAVYKNLSPTERKPDSQKKYFRRVASNFSDLLAAGYFA